MTETLAAFIATQLPADRWEWQSNLPTDVEFDAFEAVVNVYDFDWHLAVWWNKVLAQTTRRHNQNRKLGFIYDPFTDIRGSLDTAAGFRHFTDMAKRLPWSEARCADHLAMALRHVVKANVDTRIPTWKVYDAARGVWRDESEEGVAGLVTDCILQFGSALGHACDAARDMIDIVEPHPGPEPDLNTQGVTQRDVDEWNAAMERRKQMDEILKKPIDMARKIPRGKYSTLRSELKTRVGVAATAWDSETRWLVLRDGVIDVEDVYAGREVTLLPHSPKHMSTMGLDVAWTDASRNAGKSEWERGVEKVLPDPEVRTYLQKRFGASLLGRPGTAGKSMVWQYGPGDTAKSTLQECIAGAKGVFAPLAIVTSADSLTDRGAKTGASERFRAYARGKRFVLMSELREGEMLDQAVVKSVTGGETVEGTAKYSNAVSYFFTATIFMASNHPPTFPPGDTALVGRIHVVPFDHRLWVRSKNPDEWEQAAPEHRADEDWASRVLEQAQERRAIFAWVLEGLGMFGREGLGKLPEAMLEAREDFAADADPVGRLVRTLLGTEPGWEGPTWLRIWTDSEWMEAGKFEGDGIQKARLLQLINARARELSMTKFGENDLSQKWQRAALSMLNELGGLKKKAMVDRESRRVDIVWARITEENQPAVTRDYEM